MYICQKCKNHTTGIVKQITFEVMTPYGVAHEYKDCVVCDCGEIICCAPAIDPVKVYMEYWNSFEE